MISQVKPHDGGSQVESGERSLRRLYDAHTGKVSDKWSLYLETYDRIFSDLRNEPIRLLEIGVQNGGSLELWRKYFPRAELILGCDVDPACGMLKFSDENIKVIVGDANADRTNEEIKNISEKFDIVIDDGSHNSSDIVKSFARYFGSVCNNGVYIAEDLHCSYWESYEGGIYHPLSSMAFFKRLLDIVNHEHWGVDRKRTDALATFSKKYGVTFDESVLASIHTIEFLNSLCVLRKRPQAQNTIGPRRVAGSEALAVNVVMKWDGETAKATDESGNRWSLLSETMEEEILNGRELVSRHAETMGQLQDELAARRREIQDCEASIAVGDARIHAQRLEVAALEQQIATLDQTRREQQAVVLQKDKQLQHVLADLDRARADIEEIRGSTSWRITLPLRVLSTKSRQLLRQIEAAVCLLRGSPRIFVFLVRRWRERGTKGMIGRLRLSLRQGGLAGTVATVRRVAFNERRLHLPTVPSESAVGTEGPGLAVPRSLAVPEYVQHSKRAISFDPPVRVLAHYLPQFHGIPENDKWWGTGFTEWTNVRPARPAFPGHYQPHVPDYLGYYDLNDAEVIRRQTEIAKQYGVHGFCFYFYWFAGQTLLEMPLKKFLEDETIEFPYCICWANENWTRRWDGLDSELLIAQHYSPDDDIAFIAHVAQYLRDPRYVRVDGKPLLMVYRPSLLPDAKATALRWRKWCRANGVGEIQLVYTQSFEKVDPGNYGFDAASEFPPNNSHIPELQIANELLPEGFSGHVYDWSALVERSDKYDVPGYTLYRAVCPSWDNSPRRGLRASILVNSNPALFGKWLFNAIGQTLSRRDPKQSDIVFVNAWNEWAEGAHLEPDQRYGFAWLEAVRVALIKQSEAIIYLTNPGDVKGRIC